MTLIEMKDSLQEQFDRNLPTVDADRGWDRLRTRLAEWPSPEMTRRRRERLQSTVATAAGVVAIVIALVTVAALGLFSSETRVVSENGPTSPSSMPTSMTSPTTVVTSVPRTTTTTEISVETTSPGWAARSRAAMGYSLQLGEAIISYLNGEQDLASVETLVAPSAQDDLALMLSSISEPTACNVTRIAGSDSNNVVQVWLQFTGTNNQQYDFSLTMVVEEEDVTITAIEPGAVPGP